MLKGELTLTAKGRAKIAKVLAAAIQGAEEGLFDVVRTMREGAAELAPTPAQEGDLLSVGTSTDSLLGGGEIGTTEGGRFLRSGMIPVQEAIRVDPIEVDRASGTNVVTAATGDPQRINARTGFSWLTRNRGEQGPTLPFDHKWVQALEDGGAWTVTPRGNWLLEPEPGVTASAMHKTVAPHHMYQRARLQNRVGARNRVMAIIRQRVREVAID
jgi:hypothetical protein